jgi:Uma2 family endonuclease
MSVASLPKPKKEPRLWTYDEMLTELPETNQLIELWDGKIIVSPAPSFFHQQLILRLYRVLDDWVKQRHLGQTATCPVDMVLSPHRTTQPDVLYVSRGRRNIIQEAVMGAADLVMEVISPTSRSRDRIDKRDLYEQHGVKEYWLVDPEAQTVEIFFLEKHQYQLVGRWRPGEEASSRLLEGLKVDVEKLFVPD